MRLKQEATIDKQMEALINKERVRWKLILARIIGVVKTLFRNSLPFRGSNEKIYEKNNGLFCQLTEFLTEFENTLMDLKLNIDDIRGQSYDNGSNMKGKHQGVQKR